MLSVSFSFEWLRTRCLTVQVAAAGVDGEPSTRAMTAAGWIYKGAGAVFLLASYWILMALFHGKE